MKIEQRLFDPAFHGRAFAGDLGGQRPQVVLAFGGRSLLEQPALLAALQRSYPGSRIVLASTSGEILGTTITDDHVAVTALLLERSRAACVATTVRTQFESREAGRTLAQRLRGFGLSHVIAFSDGQLVNGTALADGFNDALPPGVTLTGGLAGDGTRFERTVVGLDEVPIPGRIVAVGLYGSRLKLRFGSSGGWRPGGDEHTVTAAEGNLVFQLDGRPALDLYRIHLGAAASHLPASGLSFPFCTTPAAGGPSVVRSVLAVDENSRSLLFAGDVPPGSHIRFMHASQDDLIEGAALAARQARLEPAAELALCVSCVGRRVVLGTRTSEELEKVRDILGGALLAGFYSYGELAPTGSAHLCQLHNQTMTIATLREE